MYYTNISHDDDDVAMSRICEYSSSIPTSYDYYHNGYATHILCTLKPPVDEHNSLASAYNDRACILVDEHFIHMVVGMRMCVCMCVYMEIMLFIWIQRQMCYPI